jgi:sugar lactone lactonase YvrE
MVRKVVPGVLTLLLVAARYASAQVETVALFNPSLLETPESIAIDHDNNKYVSLALTGEIRKIAPDGAQSTYVMLPLGAPPLTFCGSFFGGLTGITFDEHENLYASLASCDPGSRGVRRIPRDGQPATRIAALSMQSLPNGIVHHRDAVYVADSVVGAIWRVADTGGTAELWASGQKLTQVPNGLPGPNGLKLFEGELYVSNPSQGSVVAVRVSPDGTVGTSRTHAAGVFCDDFASDVHGNLIAGPIRSTPLCASRLMERLETILAAVDGLDGPTAVVFGRKDEGSRSLTSPTPRSRSSRSRRRVFQPRCACSPDVHGFPSRSSA